MSFYTSLSGLRASQTDLSTISNNIANVGSVGFKRSRAEFGDIMPPSKTSAGQGTRLKGITQQFTQGGFETSARELDLAISGTGFFVTRDSLTGGTTYFTRAGSMQIDPNRYLTDSNGAFVQVLPVDANGNVTASEIGAARNLQLPLTSGTPRATSNINLEVRLPSGAAKPTVAFDATDPNSFNYSQQTTVYDSTGKALPATLYFVRTESRQAGDSADSWEAHLMVGDQEASTAAGATTPITLEFDASGAMTAPTGPVTYQPVSPSGAATPLTLTMDFAAATQQSSGTFTVAALEQDGVASSKLSDLSIGEDGLITGTFSDGTTQALGKLLIANFSNPSGLRQQGDARWTVTGDSGPAMAGTPGEEGFGRIQSGALERANVDITEELVGLISAQRNFQANAKAIETSNAITQSIMNLRS